jgi:hypothetical protein
MISFIGRKIIQMRKVYSEIVVLLMLSGWTAIAQSPPTLNIANTTPGYVSLTFTDLSYSFALQTTTNLSRPTTWNMTDPFFNALHIPTVKSQQFFRLVPFLPVFQFAIFYNLNMEIDPGSTMNINGPVFSNAGIWSGNGNITYLSTVQAVDQIALGNNDPFCLGKSDAGNSIFALVGQPTSGAAPLTMLAGAHAILDLPPSSYALGTAAAYTTNGQVYLADAADLLVFNSVNGTNYGSRTPYGTNFTLYYQNGNLTQIPYDFFLVTNIASRKLLTTNYVTDYQLANILHIQNSDLTNYSGAVMYAGYSFLTNVLFYDAREGWSSGNSYGRPVQAVQIDIGKFNAWLTNSAATNNGTYFNNQNVTDKGHSINSIYVYNGAGLTGTTNLTNSLFMGAVRLINGAKLPSSGLTVATPFPIYVLGNYNVTGASGTKAGVNNQTAGYTYPAALLGDAVTVLSANWSDSPHIKSSPTTPVATTVNAACLEGIVQSVGSSYSGGVENFLRLLENWNGIKLTYNGSIVVMFPSQVAVGSWNGSYYTVPTRAWAFDTNFKNQSGLPPLTPMVVNFITP